jgi:hypothetical protein
MLQEAAMTATIALNDRLVNRAKELSGINDTTELLEAAFQHFLKGAELREAAHKAVAAAGGENPFWEDYDPKA